MQPGALLGLILEMIDAREKVRSSHSVFSGAMLFRMLALVARAG
jgi:hypothetical protein